MSPMFDLQPQMRGMVDGLNASVLGCEDQMETAVLTFFANGHISGYGEPGTGKTRMALAIAAAISDAVYAREQMVPDTMPADLVGTEVKAMSGDGFTFIPAKLTPLVNIHHVDEINRAVPRTQAALLQAMEERIIDVSGFTKTRIELSDIFMLVATQNPLDFEGTYPLPAAQLDRFATQLYFPALNEAQQLAVLKKTSLNDRHALDARSFGKLTLDGVRAIRKEIAKVVVSDDAYIYANRLVLATRPESAYCPPELTRVFKLRKSVSPRGGQWLIRLAQARAYLHGREYVKPEDVKFNGLPVLRHRVHLLEDQEMAGWTADKAVELILEKVSPVA